MSFMVMSPIVSTVMVSMMAMPAPTPLPTGYPRQRVALIQGFDVQAYGSSLKCILVLDTVPCMSEVVRIGSIIIFHLSELRKAKFFILCDRNISGEAAGEI